VDPLTALFLAAAVLLIASEALHLSLIPVFLGIAALIVAGLRGVGLVESLPASLLVWSVTSVALTLPLRPIVKKYLKLGELKVDPSDENKDALGTIVDVLEAIDDSSEKGRIRFQGTTWSARSTEGVIPAGSKARLFAKDKLVWVVEPLSVLDDVNQVPSLAEHAEQIEAEIAGKKR
jgi:membrane protein implicated in regulation of membrane protease activity